MTSTEAAGGLQFEAPGPGSYKQDPVHFPRPLTRYWTEVHPAAFARGTAEQPACVCHTSPTTRAFA